MKKLVFLLILGLPAFGQSTHSVTVNWSASPDAAANPTLSYNVYRSVSSCASPSFVLLKSTAAGISTFNDSAVSVGNTYCYTVTSVLNGLESAAANSAQAVILPSSPSAVTVTVK